MENRLRHLVGTGRARSIVMAPVAWFPGRGEAVAAEEHRHGLRVLHPRWFSVPAVGMRVAPGLLYAAAARALAGLLAEGQRFDLIDAHYFYPDGVAAIRLGRRFGLPVIITARGSDVTQFPDFPAARRLILRAARDADALITVSAGLRDALAELGAPTDKITVLRNGVDLAIFQPQPREAARHSFDVRGRVMVSVGALIERKGHHRTIEALAALPNWHLLIAGEGTERARLQALADRLGVAGRMRLLGPLPHEQLAMLYSAADLSVLASSREGWANVLLESMACGTPVVASPIPGNPEVVREPAAGLIAGENSAAGIAEAVRAWEGSHQDRAATRRYAEFFGWDATSEGQLAVFAQVLRDRPETRGPPAGTSHQP